MNNGPRLSFELMLSDHARRRMAQRNVSERDISYIMGHGQESHCAGARLVTLRQCDISRQARQQATIARLEGVTLVLSRDEPLLLTVWRNRRAATRRIRRKPGYNLKPAVQGVNKWR